MADTITIRDIMHRLATTFGSRQGYFRLKRPPDLHFMPTWAFEPASQIICDAPIHHQKSPRGFATGEVYFPVTVQPQATFLCYLNNDKYSIFCSPDTDFDQMFEAITKALNPPPNG
jgi:hypothetical protein